MKCAVAVTVAALVLFLNTASVSSRYQPTWKSIDSRPVPQWFDEAKFGIFIHWGVFSVPSFRTEWFWRRWLIDRYPDIIDFMKKNYKPDFTYQDFAKDLKAEFFDAESWVKLFQDAGAKYIIFTGKHHEGYTNWPSKYSYSWNAMDVGPKRDIVGELADATRKYTDLKFGLYHSLYEWFDPLFLEDSKNNFTTRKFVEAKTLPEMHEIVEKYRPEIVATDGDWNASATYWQSREFLAWLYNDSPVKDTVVTFDRWGIGTSCHHGGVITCNDEYDPGHLGKRKWATTQKLDRRSWAYRREARLKDFRTIENLLQTFVRTVSCNGNFMVNIGPPSHGHIPPLTQERLRQMGSWLKVNGEGIYKSRPWTYQNDTVAKNIWYTMRNSSTQKDIYAFIYDWPSGPTLTLTKPAVAPTSKVSLLGYDGDIHFQARQKGGIDIQVPAIPASKMPCEWLWTFKITDVGN